MGRADGQLFSARIEEWTVTAYHGHATLAGPCSPSTMPLMRSFLSIGAAVRERDGGVEDSRVWMACFCGAGLSPSASPVEGGHGPCAAWRPLLNSRPACKEGSRIEPARLPHAPHPLAPDSQTACFSAWLKVRVLSRAALTLPWFPDDRPEIRQHLKWPLTEESRLRRQGWLH